MYVVFNMGIIYYGVLQFKLRYVIQEIYLFLLHTFHVRTPFTCLHEYLLFALSFMNFFSMCHPIVFKVYK